MMVRRREITRCLKATATRADGSFMMYFRSHITYMEFSSVNAKSIHCVNESNC